MRNAVKVLDEPMLEFRHSQQVADPRDGLSLFGPCDVGSPGRPSSISYGVVGTAEGLDLFSAWSQAMILAWTNAPNDRHRLWPPYPGFQSAFECNWNTESVCKKVLNDSELSDVAHRHDPHERVYSVVDQYLTGFEDLLKLDERVDIMVCVVPDEIYQTCRPHSRVTDPTGRVVSKERRERRRRGQQDMFSNFKPEQYELSLDFRRQIKARTMYL